MKVLLVVYLMFTSEGWAPGWEVWGWHPREQPDLSTCLARAEFANKKSPPRGISKWAWVCKQVPAN